MLHECNTWLTYCTPIFSGIRGRIRNVLLHSGDENIAETSDI